MCVTVLSITLKISDMSGKTKRSAESYGTFLIKNALDPPSKKVTYDDLLGEMGEFGLWQQWQIFLYSLPPFMSGALFMLGTFTSKLALVLN